MIASLHPQMSFVNEKLPKPGIQFSSAAFGHPSIQELFHCGVITRDLLAQAGFIVIHDCHSGSPTEQPSLANSTQFLHKDNGGVIDGITLRSRENGRSQADTVLACDDDCLLEATLSHLNRCDMIKDIRKLSVADAVRWRCRGDIKRAIELQGPVPGLYDNADDFYDHPGLPALYTLLEKQHLLYSHQWQQNQLLVIDNKGMVHARANRESIEPPVRDKSPLLRAGFFWKPGDVLFL